MKQANYDLSYKKWNDKDGIVAEFRKPGRVDWEKVNSLLGRPCGHCKEQNYKPSGCRMCNLNILDLCHSKASKAWYSYLRRMAYNYVPRNKRTGKRIAERIFSAILKDDPKGGQ